MNLLFAARYAGVSKHPVCSASAMASWSSRERKRIMRCCSFAHRLAEERVLERMTEVTPSGW